MPNLDPSNCADHPSDLSALRSEVSSLFLLAYDTLQAIDRSLPGAPAAIAGIDPNLPFHKLADELWRTLGRRKALFLRTRLSQLAEREDGQRQGGRGRDRVRRAPAAVEIDADL